MRSMRFTKENREWELPDAFYRISIKVIAKDDDGKLLVVKDTNTDTWEIPGGGLDHGETIEQTAKREIQEELGVELTKLDSTPIVIEPGLHPNNYATVMLYYRGALSSYDFTLEKKFESKFVGKEEFLRLEMLSDESPIQKHSGKIWRD